MNRKYKYKGSEIDLDLLIHNLNHNYSSWAEHITKNPLQRQELDASFNEFIKAIEAGRISTLGTGQLEDSEGILTNQDANTGYYNEKGKYITSDEFNKLRKGKQKDYNQYMSNLHLVNFVNLIAEGVYSALTKRNKEKEEAKRKEEASKESIEAKLNAAWSFEEGDADLTPYWNKDPLNETTKKRGTTERIKFLSKELKNLYPNYQQDEKLNNLITLLDVENASFDDNIQIAMDKAGINSSWYHAFFKTDFTNPEEAKKRELERQNSELRKIDEEVANWYNNLVPYELPEIEIQQPTNNINLNDYITDPNLGVSTDYMNRLIKELVHPNTKQPVISYNDEGNELQNNEAKAKAIQNFLDTILTDLINNFDSKPEYRMPALLLAGILSRGGINDVFIGKNKYSQPLEVIRIKDNDAAYISLVYNKATGKLLFIPQNRLQNKGKEIWNKKFEELHSPELPSSYITKNLLGGYVELRNKYINEKAKEKGQSILEYEVSNRKVDEFTTTDIIRLGAIGADIISMISAFLPGYGTLASGVTGIGSSIANLYADLSEDDPQWSDVGNFITNLGFDLVGLIPAVGVAGKSGKIVKTLAKYGPKLVNWLAVTGAAGTLLNAGEIKDSLSKVINNEDATVLDWRNVADLIKTVAGGTGAIRRKVATNPKIDESKVALQFKDNEGNIKTVGFSGEDANKIKDFKTSDEVKSYLQDKGFNYGELITKQDGFFGMLTQSMFPSWNPKKWRLPIKEADYKAQILDIGKVRTFNKGKLSEPNEVAIKDNILYDLFTPEKPGNNLIRLWNTDIAKRPDFNLLLSIKGKSKSEISKMFKTQEIDGVEYIINPSDKKLIRLDDLYKWSIKRKQGGTLNIAKVKKFENGNSITNSKKDGATWINVMYDPFLKYLDNIYESNKQKLLGSRSIVDDDWVNNWINDFNALQDSYYNNYTKSNYSKNPNSKLNYLKEVATRQTLFNLTGMNSGITKAIEQRLLIPSGNSGDNLKGGYKDGYFGELEFLRHFGTVASWKGKEKELKEVTDILKGMGLAYYVDNNGMYKIRRATDPVEELLTVTEDTSTLSQEEREDLHNEAIEDRKRSLVDGLLGGLNDEIPEKNKSWFSQLLENPTLTFGLPRAIAADWVNKRMRDKAIANEKALLLNPFEFNRYVQGNLDAIKLGEQEMAALMNLGEDLSDPTLAYARKFEAFKEGLNRVKQGYLIDNQARQQSQEANWKQTKENALSEYQVGQQNKYSLRESEANKLKYDLAYDAKKHEIWDTLGKQLEYDARLGIQERKAKQELLDKLTRQYNIMYNLGKYMPQLNTDALVLWNEVLNGTKKLSTLTPQEEVLYKEAQRAYETAVLAETAKAYNLKLNLFIPNSNSYKPDITLLPSEKNGGSIKNADRFYKSIKDDLDRNEKKLDRLFKSLYTLKRRLK